MLPFGYIGGEWRDSAIFGIFDGHGGEQVARFAARQLPTALAGQPPANAEAALTNAYLCIDEALRRPQIANELRDLTLPGCESRSSAESCGTTAVVCLVRGGKLHVANVGDSRAVLCRHGTAVQLTEDHKPWVKSEIARIEAADGYVEEEATPGGKTDWRVMGNLNLSRALGDLKYKDASLPPVEQMVSGVPDTQTREWKAGEDDFVLLACDGVWDCMSGQEAVNFVKTRLPPAGAKRGLVPVLEALVDACCAQTPTQRGGLGCDNVTAVLLRFEDPDAASVFESEAAEMATEAEEKTMSVNDGLRLDAALGATLQRLSSRRRAPTAEELEEREARAKQEAADEERSEKERLERKRRREERESQAQQTKKRVHCCAAGDEDEDDDDDDVFS